MTVEELKIEADKLGYNLIKKVERKQKAHRRYIKVYSNNYNAITNFYNSNRNIDKCTLEIRSAILDEKFLCRGKEFKFCWRGRVDKMEREQLVNRHLLQQINNSVLKYELKGE